MHVFELGVVKLDRRADHGHVWMHLSRSMRCDSELRSLPGVRLLAAACLGQLPLEGNELTELLLLSDGLCLLESWSIALRDDLHLGQAR